jgi:predicted flap endonuclease-1-like 5' DNA nuclease
VEQAEPEPEPEAAAQDDAFEQVELPAEPPAEVAAAEGELEPAAATEFEVEEVEEEAAGVHPAVLAHLSRSEKHQPVDMLPGVGPAYAQRLRDAGVRNLVDLLQRDPDELAAQTYLPVEEIRRWHTVGQFQAIDGVGPAYADVLVRAGVQGLPDLAQQQPQPLAQRLKPFEGQGARATPDMLADWIHQAQRILEQSSAPGPASEFEIVEEEDAVVEEGAEPAYQVNEFTLYARESRRGGKARTTYFFSAEPVEDARPSPLPDGYEVLLNESTGVPVVRKSTARILPVRDIEGLGPVMAERLERAGIKTTKELRGIDVREVSGATGISERLLANYRSMAELLQVPTVQPEHASAMVYAGVRTIPDLLNATPTELAKQMHQAAKDFQLKLKQKVTAQKVRGWQERAM